MFKKKSKGIEEVFSFLLNNGFYLKDKFQIGELELVYSNNVFNIIITSGESVNDQFEKCPFFCIIIESVNIYENIIECKNIFPNEKLQVLKKSCDGLSVNLQIEIYAKFLEHNLTYLTRLE